MNNRVRGECTGQDTFFEHTLAPVLLTDFDGRIVAANRQACALLRYERAALLELRIDMIHRTAPNALKTEHIEALRPGDEIEFRSIATRADGSEIDVLVKARRIDFDGAAFVEWVEQDIRSQVELEKLRNDLTSMIYHDLRGPLHNIQSSIMALRRLYPTDSNPVTRDILDVAVLSSRQLSRLIDNLLDMQRLEEDKVILKRKPTALSEMLERAVELLRPMADDANVRFVYAPDGDLPIMMIDDDMILRVVLNLAENAVKFTPAGGTVELTAAELGDRVEISVFDDGPGIPQQAQHFIFDKFSRVKYDHGPGGMGLGLAFCRLAVESHGGHIHVESAPGEGSRFTFSLPVEPQVE